jgi:transcriptional regulator with XRE-family HTH domain
MLASRSLGRRFLLSIIQRTTQREIAARCRVAPSTVTAWVRGDYKPGKFPRWALERSYEIPASSWDVEDPSLRARRAAW